MRHVRIPRPSHGKRNTESRASTMINPNGAALRLVSPAGSPPLVVNRQAKVTNLNADKLDGLSSSAFLPVDGTQTVYAVCVS